VCGEPQYMKKRHQEQDGKVPFPVCGTTTDD
jgi:hypothetical protein